MTTGISLQSKFGHPPIMGHAKIGVYETLSRPGRQVTFFIPERWSRVMNLKAGDRLDIGHSPRSKSFSVDANPSGRIKLRPYGAENIPGLQFNAGRFGGPFKAFNFTWVDAYLWPTHGRIEIEEGGLIRRQPVAPTSKSKALPGLNSGNGALTIEEAVRNAAQAALAGKLGQDFQIVLGDDGHISGIHIDLPGPQ